MTGGPTQRRVAGATVAGVRLGQLVGRGSTGEVWAGTDLLDGTRVAVKLLAGVPAVVDGALAQQTGHPHVLEVRRVSHDPPAVVTVLAGGGSLAAQVQARGCLRPGEVVTVVAPLADALAWLHARGVVHGDVSATNVLFVERGRPVLGDLGSAGLAGTGSPVATPGFAAPEVVAGGDPSPAADVHGLAAVAWLALTGAVPPAAEDRLPLRLLVPECPDELLDAVTAGLDPDPRRRPPPSDLAAAARAATDAEPVGLVPSAALGVRADEAVTYRVRASAARQRPSPAPGRRRWPHPRGAMAAAVLTLLLVAAGGAVSHRLGDPPPTVAAADDATVATTVASTTVPGTLDGPGLEREVRALVGARQAALRSGDVDLLARVHHPDGTTLAGDRELLRSGPVDVSYEVLSVEAVGPLDSVDAADVADHPDDDGAVEAAVSLTTTTDGAAAVLEDVVVRIDQHDGRWLVSRVAG
ncbi:protein kinase domain-containing protein [Aquipuribacter sp. MA13-6]|uniref:protein kinase domain-containing protein n=1 Tax=unclassified Aquipuribacter TaxID=2635084 RepID=UPI003EF06B16